MKTLNLKRELLDLERDQIIELYQSGLSSEKIAKMVDRDGHTIRDILKNNNVQLRVWIKKKNLEIIDGIFNVDYKRNWIL